MYIPFTSDELEDKTSFNGYKVSWEKYGKKAGISTQFIIGSLASSYPNLTGKQLTDLGYEITHGRGN